MQATLTIERSVVGKCEDEVKTLASASVLPLHELLIQELRDWPLSTKSAPQSKRGKSKPKALSIEAQKTKQITVAKA